MLTFAVLASVLSPAPQELLPPLLVHTVTANGEPIASAEVFVVRGYRGSVDGDIVFSSGYRDPVLLQRHRTDLRGVLSLRLPHPGNRGSMPSEIAFVARVGERWCGAAAFDAYSFPADGTLTLVDSGAAPRAIRVLDQGGQPLSGARVTLHAVRSGKGCVALPEELRSERVTDERGEVTLAAAAPQDIAGIVVRSDRLGVQRISAPDAGFDEVTLRAVGRVTGRIDAGNRALPPGIRIEFQAAAPPLPNRTVPRELRRTSGFGEVTVGSDGRFELPTLTEGVVFWRTFAPPGSSVQWHADGVQELKAGETLTLRGDHSHAALAHGVIRGSGGAPIAGVHLRIGRGVDQVELETDANGRFRAFVAPGHLGVCLFDVPPPFLPDTRFQIPFEVPADAAEHELPAIELERGRELGGRVVDPRGVPVPNALVFAEWSVQEAMGQMQLTRPSHRLAVSGEDGSFRLQGLAEHVPNVHVRALGRTSEPVLGEGDAELVLTLPDTEASATTTLWCRVVDLDGRPVPGARATLLSRKAAGGRYAASLREVERPNGLVMPADADGLLRLDERLDPELSYALTVTGPDGGSVCTRLLPGLTGGELAFGDVRLRTVRSVAGRVVDAEGEPVAGVRVFQRGDGPRPTETQSARDGTFRLDGVWQGEALVFAEGEQGFAGAVVAGTGTPVILALGVPAPPPPAAAPHPTSLELARRVLAPLLEAAIERGDASSKLRALQTAAWVDAAWALDQLERTTFPEPWYADHVRAEVVRALAVRSPEQALVVLPGMQQADRRAFALIEVAKNLNAPRLLDEAFLWGRASAEPQMRLVVFAKLANEWFDLGDEERARRALAVAAPIAAQLPDQDWPAFARCRFAEQLAKFDLDAALAITKTRGDGFDWDRHHGNIAHELADRDPAAAERVFGMLRQQPGRYVARICHRMAAVDPDRAEAIARGEGITPSERAYALGMMALQLADADAELARRLLEESFGILGKEQQPQIAAALLPVAERVAPLRLREFAMRAIVSRGGLESTSIGRRVRSAESIAQLALLLLRYFPPEAAVVAAPLWTEAHVLMSSGSPPDGLVPALALLDPKRCVELIEAMPAPPDPGIMHNVNRARLAAAKALARTDPARWDWLTEDHLGLWIVGKEDL